MIGFRYTTLSNSRDYNTNTYTSGPTDPFGTPTIDSEQMSIYATYSTSYTTTYAYNDADQLTSEVDPRGGSYSYTFKYDSRGNLLSTSYPNGTYSLDETNPDGWLTAICNEQGTLPSSPPTNGTCPTTVTSKIAEYTYTYNQDGTKSQEVLAGPASQTTAYSYDSAGRLQSYTLGATTTTYCYDRDSNRLQVTTGSCSTNTYTYNPASTNSPGADELTSVGSTNYQYTADGQLQCRWNGTGTCPTGSDTYRWDGAGILYSATVGGKSVCYRFGANGALASRVYDSTGSTTCTTGSSTTKYLLDDLFETNASGTITTSYQEGPSGDVASFNGAPTTLSTPTYLYYDGHGDLAAEAGSAGTRTTAHTYDPFGAPSDAPSNATSHRYTGRWDKQDDTTTGLILMGARPYDPTLGRFIAVDPVDGGSLNNYDYTGQDPINGYDLNGTMWDPESGLIGVPFENIDPDTTTQDEGDPSESNVPTVRSRIRGARLPANGKVRYVPPSNYKPGNNLPGDAQRGFRDRYGNLWQRGPAHGKAAAEGDSFEWDVQLGPKWSRMFGETRINVTQHGEISH